ncbi:MAG: hypothetical protein ND866_03550 [Pyrinomonadaceae bacterium]|nr:hypothetical protein [Pyrinomonadaceae bacterium]
MVALRRHAYPTCGGGISEIIVKLTIPSQRYATPLPQLTGEVTALAAQVDEHLKKMGAVWN